MNSFWSTILMVLLSYISLPAQNKSTKSFADQPANKMYLPVKEDIQKDFVSHFNIDLEEREEFITIDQVEMFLKPVNNSEKSDILIPKEQIIEVFDYYPKYAMYAVHYNGHWGFIPATGIKPAPERTVRQSRGNSDPSPILISKISVNYPEAAKKQKISGVVLLRLLVSKTGSVEAWAIEKSIPELDSAAIKTVRKLKFKPARLEGKPVDIWIRFPVEFVIPD